MELFAITYTQHPLTGEAMPEIKKLTLETTMGELVNWYRLMQNDAPGRYQVYDLRIKEATPDA